MKPIFHLSFPVRDLDEAIAFYRTSFSAIPGRREANWADIALFGAQITLQLSPQDGTDPMPRSRHFGTTLSWTEWEAVAAQLTGIIEGPKISHQGTEKEQAKAMLRDPSGNLIEIKAYRHPEAVLPGLREMAS